MKRLTKWVIPILTITLLFILALPFHTVYAATKYESYEVNDDNFIAPNTTQQYCQTFTPSTNHTVSSVYVKAYKVGTPGTLNVDIKAVDGSSKPTGAALATGSIDPSTFTTDSGGSWYEITLGAGAAITASTEYAIVFRSSGSSDVNNCTRLRSDNTSPTYAGGQRGYSSNSGSTWAMSTSYDILFQEWDTTATVAPTVSTSAASSVSYTTATLNGEITDFGTATSAVVTFEYGLTTGYGSTATASESPMSGTGTFHADITSLDQNTLYHFRAKVDADDTDPVYGSDLTFTTLTQSPTVTTIAATSVEMDKDGLTTGQFNGELTSLGDDTEADVSFIYGSTVACSDGETTPATLDATGTFDNSAEFPDDWTPGATYYYKAKAVNTHGTSYGSVQSIVFTMPTFTTQAATYTSPGVATADLNGNISNMGVATGCYAYFEYGTSTSYGSSTTPQTFTIADDVEDTISGFLHNVTIHYRLVIEVGETTVNGNDITFLIAPNELTQVLWYQPIDIIHQVEGDWILPDRASTEDGIITWGTNPEGITVSNSLLISNGSIGVIGTNQHDAIPALGTDMTGTDTAQTDNILFSLFSPIATMTNFPLWILFTILGLVAIVLTMIYVTKHTQNQMLGAGAGLVVTFLFYKIGVFDWWMFFVPVVMFAAILVMERKPSL